MFKNSIFNFLGVIIPILIGLFTIPFLINNIGVDIFGKITIIWAIIGYSGLFDLGIGKGITQIISLDINKKKYNYLGDIIGTSISIIFVFSIFLSIIFYVSASSIVNIIENLNIDVYLIQLLAIAIFPTLIISVFRSIHEAKSLFLIINLIRVPNNIWLFIAPIILIFLDDFTLNNLVIYIILGKLFFMVLYCISLFINFKEYLFKFNLSKSSMYKIFNVSGWISISNIINPLLAYLDRFIIGATLSAAAVSYFVTPFELSSKIWIIPAAITSTLFPFITSNLKGDLNLVYKKFTIYEFASSLIVLLCCIICIMFNHDIISLWISKEFADQSAKFLTIFSIGMFFSSLGHFPLTVLHANGNFKIPAILNIIMIIFYPIIFYSFVKKYGLDGAIYIWLFRVLIDYIVIYYFSLTYIIKQSIISNFNWSIIFLILLFSIPLSNIEIYTFKFVFLFLVIIFSYFNLKSVYEKHIN
tara:strand:- start:182 stop:1597 length:1416 start_codon:yes stop_codon:yes gene_type:complete